MKRTKFILLLIALYTMNGVYSQIDITLDNINGQLVNGTEVEYFQSPGSAGVHMYDFHITNNTGVSQQWVITRKIISQPTEWSNYICWGGLCYAPSPINEWTSDPGIVENAEAGVLSTYISTPNEGSSHYRYYVSTDGSTFIDSVDIVVEVVLGTSVNAENSVEIEIYPNPAQNYLTVKMNNIEKAELIIYDATGKMVLINTLDQNMNALDISSLSEGCYYYTIRDMESNYIKRDALIIIE